MTKYCHILNVRSQDLFESLEAFCESLECRLNLLLADILDNNPDEFRVPYFHDVLKKVGICEMHDLGKIKMRPVANVPVFCFAVRFWTG